METSRTLTELPQLFPREVEGPLEKSGPAASRTEKARGLGGLRGDLATHPGPPHARGVWSEHCPPGDSRAAPEEASSLKTREGQLRGLVRPSAGPLLCRAPRKRLPAAEAHVSCLHPLDLCTGPLTSPAPLAEMEAGGGARARGLQASLLVALAPAEGHKARGHGGPLSSAGLLQTQGSSLHSQPSFKLKL